MDISYMMTCENNKDRAQTDISLWIMERLHACDKDLGFRLPELKVPMTYMKSYAKMFEIWLKIQE